MNPLSREKVAALPEQIRKQLELCRAGEPAVALRASYDLDGTLGDTHVLGDAGGLRLFSRKLGEDYRGFEYGWGEVSTLRAEADGLYRVLVVSVPAATWRLRFAAWEEHGLKRLIGLWRDAMGATAELAPRDPEGVRSPGGAEEAGVLFGACLAAMAKCDDQWDEAEARLMVEITGRPEWIEEGRRRLETVGLGALLRASGGGLSPVQRRCLLGNLLRVGMEDGWLRGAERELVEQCRDWLGLEASVLERIERVLMSRYRLSVLDPGEGGGVGVRVQPLVCLLALVQALVPAPDRLTRAELEDLQRRVGDPDAWERATAWRQGKSMLGLLTEAGGVLDGVQRRCVLANLVGLAIADGALSREEQETLEGVRAAWGISPGEHAELVEVLAETAGTGVFHGGTTTC